MWYKSCLTVYSYMREKSGSTEIKEAVEQKRTHLLSTMGSLE